MIGLSSHGTLASPTSVSLYIHHQKFLDDDHLVQYQSAIRF